ncbi:MAG: penicillin-binding protein 2, partial [Pseudomonadota bacterium]
APFRFIKRHISPRQEAYLRGVGDPGLQFEDEFRRVYPGGSLAAHVVGFTNADGEGKLGIERAFDRRLYDEETRTSPLRLSIDARVQHAMENVLATDIQRFRAEAGMGVLVHIATGEVLAMASLPTFDPNNVASSPAGFQANRVTNRAYELGSTFKAFTFAQAFELGLAQPNDVCDASVPLSLGMKQVHDRWALRRPITMAQALIRSSNTCTGRLGDAIGAQRQREFLRSLGFLSPLSIELHETSGYRMSSSWGRFATVTISYGHGIAVTPLHLAQGAATLLNQGRPVQATLIPQNPVMKDGLLEKRTGAVSDATISTIRQLLRLTVLNGTGGAADVAGLRVGGKTGTAERARTDALGYEEEKNITTFLGAFPMEAPEYVVVMILDSPQAEADSALRGAGANVAGSAGRFIQRAASFLGVMPRFGPESWLDQTMIVQAQYTPPPGWRPTP